MPPEENRPVHAPPSPTPPPETEGGLPRLRTMKYDASQYLKEKNISLIDLVTQEKKRSGSAHEDMALFEYEPRRTWLRVLAWIVGIALVALAGYAGFILFFKQPGAVSPSLRPPQAIVAVEGNEVVTASEGDRAGLLERLRASHQDRLLSGSIKHVIVQFGGVTGTARYATLREFFATLDMRPPVELTDNLGAAFNLLMFYPPGRGDIALVLKPKNMELALAGMRAWEPNMILDFRNLYFDDAVTQTANPFYDAIIQNVDVRVLPVSSTATLSYALFAGKYIIITTSQSFMELLINRLMTAPPVSL